VEAGKRIPFFAGDSRNLSSGPGVYRVKGASATMRNMKQNAAFLVVSLALAGGVAGCRVHVDKGANGEEKKVQVDTPFGGVHVNTDQTSAVDLGLPLYPGAEIVKGDDNEPAKKCTLKMAPGLGLIGGVIIDQHFDQRGRFGRLLCGVAEIRLLDLGLVMSADHFDVLRAERGFLVEPDGVGDAERQG